MSASDCMNVRGHASARRIGPCGASTLLVSLTLLASNVANAAVSCQVTATGPAFGIYNPLNASPALANGVVTATCTLLSGGRTVVTLVSSYSTGSSGTYASRTLVFGTNTLNYNLYLDAAYTQIHGDGTGGSSTGGATLTLTPGKPTQQAQGTIYGRMPAGQDVAAGTYLDTIVVTVTY